MQLDGLRGDPPRDPGLDIRRSERTLEERCMESRQWGAWAPGLKQALAVAMNQHVAVLHQQAESPTTQWSNSTTSSEGEGRKRSQLLEQ